MAARRRTEPRADAAVVAAPARRAREAAAAAARLAPSARSIGVGCALLAIGAGAYALTRQTSVFAIRRVELTGASPYVAAQVRRAVADWRGSSLVGLDGSELIRRVEGVPWVARADYDRAFPYTLRLVVRPEEPVAVLRAGAKVSWLVAADGRALMRLQRGARRDLPRVWVPATTHVAAGETLADAEGGAAARALAPLLHARFPVGIKTVMLREGDLFFALARGTQLRLGRPTDLRLKLAIARRIVPTLPAGTLYLDVSVPERPVASSTLPPETNTQVSGGG